MFKNHLKFTFRSLTKHKVYSGINIFGLALALACVIFILFWVENKLSYAQILESEKILLRTGEKHPTSSLNN